MKKFVLFYIVCLSLVFAESKHEHDIANLNISIEKEKDFYIVELNLDGAASNFISFEHQPKTKEEKQEWNKAKQIFNTKNLFAIFPNCVKIKTDIKLEYEENENHADLESVIEFKCKKYPKTIETKDFFETFKNLEILEVQISGKNPQYVKLNKDKTSINLK